MHTQLAAATLATLLLLSTAAAQSCPSVTRVPLEAGPNGTITSVATFNNRIIARGYFTSIGGVPTPGIAEYDGGLTTAAWTPMSIGWAYGSGYADPSANSLATMGGRVYATSSGYNTPQHPTSPVGQIWNGESWENWPTTGQADFVTASPTYSVHSVGDKLLVDGLFVFPDNNGGGYTRRTAFFDGASWQPAGNEYGLNIDPTSAGAAISATARYQGQLFVSGGFARIARGASYNQNTVNARAICTFDGAAFQPLPNGGLNGSVSCMAVFQDELYVAGNFTATLDGTIPLLNIACFSGGAWHRVGGGITIPVQEMVVADDGTGEKLHIVTSGGNPGLAYNQLPPTTDSVTFRTILRWNGGVYSRHTTTAAGLYGSGHLPVRYDNGAGEGVYFLGSEHFWSTPVNNSTRVSRWGPGPMADTDQDGIFDIWETIGGGIDTDCDGVPELDLYALGARPNHRDIFVEVDSMAGRAPDLATLNRVKDAFAAAPAELIGNPDGTPGVNLHLIVDPSDQTIPLQDFPNTWTEFHALKSQRFGNAADRDGPNTQKILDAKKRVFRYCIFANTFDNSGYSGVAEIWGNDFMVTLGAFPFAGGTPTEQAATFMHELGHTLGLNHGGHQEDEARFNYKPNYHSIMNYTWQLRSFRPGWTLDYSRFALPDLNEHELVEMIGIAGSLTAVTLAGPVPGRQVPENGFVDWNNNGEINIANAEFDINRIKADYPSSLDILEGSEDWSRLRYRFTNSPNYAAGDSPDSTIHIDTMDPQLDAELDAIGGAPPCPADLGIAGGLPGTDGTLDNNDFIAFITYFFNADPHADLGIAGGLPGADTLFDNNDFIAFITLYFEGC